MKKALFQKKYFVFDENVKFDLERTFEKLQSKELEETLDAILPMSTKKGEIDIVRVLLLSGANPNTLDCFYTAIYRKNSEMVALFLRNGQVKKVNLKPPVGQTPLQYAVWYSDLKIVALIARAGGSPNETTPDNKKSPFIRAIEEGNAGMVAYFLTTRKMDPEKEDSLTLEKADINKKWDGHTPLAIAIRKQRLEIVELLLKAGANPNELSHGKSPLAEAIAYERYDIAKLLLEKNADPNIGLKAAFEYIKPLFVELCLEFNADPKAVDLSGNTPIHQALRGHHTPNMMSISLLLSKGADINAQNAAGDTPLHLAARFYLPTLFNYLLSKGADPHILNNAGDAPSRK